MLRDGVPYRELGGHYLTTAMPKPHRHYSSGSPPLGYAVGARAPMAKFEKALSTFCRYSAPWKEADTLEC